MTDKLRVKRNNGHSEGSAPPAMRDFNLNNQESVQDYNKSQIYIKGFSIGVSTGINNSVGNIQLGGAAKRLYGLVIYLDVTKLADADTFSLSINNESIINNTIWYAFYPSVQYGNMKPQMYFPMPRPLSGSDSVEFSWTAVSAKTVYPVFYLSNFAGK